MIRIEGTSFLMGSDDGPDNERPAHCVWVDGFEIAPCQVTNAEYAKFVCATGHVHHALFGDPQQPVVGVSWFDAMKYCQWMNVRLPTEAEWECAARGGLEGKAYPWGDELPDYASKPLDGPEAVATRSPNAFGLYDMCENVHEWCSDWFAAGYYSISPERNPRGPESGTRRVSRGGSWRHQIRVSRCAARSSIPPEFRYADYGFRVVGR